MAKELTKLQTRALKSVHGNQGPVHTNELYVKNGLLKFNELLQLETTAWAFKAKNCMLTDKIRDLVCDDISTWQGTLRSQTNDQLARNSNEISILGFVRQAWNKMDHKYRKCFGVRAVKFYVKNELLENYYKKCTKSKCYICEQIKLEWENELQGLLETNKEYFEQYPDAVEDLNPPFLN